MTTVLVSGTGTGVGKTTVTAAIALLATARGHRVTVIKPAQTCVPNGEPGDLAVIVARAPAITHLELARYPQPLSPAAAARESRRWPVTLPVCTEAVRVAEQFSDLVLVEGAGGLLVPYDDSGFTMADLAATLELPVVVVTESGLGTLNATALTLEAMRTRALALHELVIGAWPAQPRLADRTNVYDLEVIARRPLGGALSAGMAGLDQARFADAARAGLARTFGGDFDADAFREAATL